jgi:hypothetical protein
VWEIFILFGIIFKRRNNGLDEGGGKVGSRGDFLEP